MLDFFVAIGLSVLILAVVKRWGWPLGAVGVWLNLAWFIYQNEWGQGWLLYLRGVGVSFMLAAGYRQYGLAWALLPWPLLLVGRFNFSLLEPYFPAWGEGLMLGALAYLLIGLFRRP
ncbi:MAG: hypothetical protein NZ849_11265 [Meiothermus sp.]|uniref:hypothetical protein n=1 Tax=Meiothermus sp. TaxID=1955249 RepID=UPI0025F366B9|nr:hypothetical protein [Meiothermus sp.]MCS7058421.1 hypothetical protein [Meiothermus sp.]MCS7195469.1 hypothetical protein [Meiothermus sp.]MCX7741278.1 hypothetical protein [Meiothermus sp.]MDW8089791.1 hypothetical protein [Meiothermus sp.]MDW8481783.1 hypothetical protein [Meiothermus sp.]